MNNEAVAALAYIYIHLATSSSTKKIQKRKPRRLWMTDLFRKRNNSGILNDLQFQHVSGQYKNFTCMDPTDFEYLLGLIGNDIAKKDTYMRQAISIQDRLALTLRFFASGDSYTSLQYLFKISTSSICSIVDEVSDALIKALRNEGFIKMPNNPAEWTSVADDFHSRWDFPHCLGSLDGKHCMMNCPPRSGSKYYNNSIIMFALVDANYNFLFVDVGTQDSLRDSTMFSESWLGKQLHNGKLNFPQPNPLPGEHLEIPYFFVGDEAFSLNQNLMRGYPGYWKKGTKERVLNYRLSRARRVVENVFGIITDVFRLLKRPMEIGPDKAQKVLLCIAYLHNFLRQSKNSKSLYCPPGSFDMEDEESGNVNPGSWRGNESNNNALQPLKRIPRHSTASAEKIRDHLAKYFLESGKISWQDCYS